MTSDLKKTPNRRRAVAIQMAGGYVNKGIIIIQGLLLIPLYLHFIGDRTYGFWLASGGILVWLNFVDMGLGALLIQRIASAYGQKDFSRAGSYFLYGLLVYVCMSGVFLILGLGLSLVLPEWLGASETEAELLRACFQLAVVAKALEILNIHFRSFSNALLRPLWPKIILISCRVAGLAAIIILLYQGNGLWAIPKGHFLASFSAFFFNVIYSILLFLNLGAQIVFDRNILKELIRLIPYVFFARIGRSLANNIEPILIALIMRPELITAFVLTRRAADMVSTILHVLIASIFPSFSHLVAEGHVRKSARVVYRIISLSFGAGLVGFGVYVTGNEAFVRLWVGPEQFIGQILTLLIGLGLLMRMLQNVLSRLLIGTGDIRVPSLLILIEAVLRVALMYVLLMALHLAGLPIGMLISCAVFAMIYYKRLAAQLSLPFFQGWSHLKSAITLAAVFSIGFASATYFALISTWLGLIVCILLTAMIFLIINLSLNPNLRSFLSELFAPLRRKLIRN